MRDLSEMLRTLTQACGSAALAFSMHRDQVAIPALHPLYQIIATTTFPLICAVYLGVAESARDLALDHAHRKPTTPDPLNLAGRVETSLRGVQRAHQAMVAAVEPNAPSGESVNDVMIGRTLVARYAIRKMELAGGAGFYRSADLERRFRDVQGARYHPLQDVPQAEYAAALPLGQPVSRYSDASGIKSGKCLFRISYRAHGPRKRQTPPLVGTAHFARLVKPWRDGILRNPAPRICS